MKINMISFKSRVIFLPKKKRMFWPIFHQKKYEITKISTFYTLNQWYNINVGLVFSAIRRSVYNLMEDIFRCQNPTDDF